MGVEVAPEIQQFILQICARPEQHVVQILPSNGADEPFHEGRLLLVHRRAFPETPAG